MTHEILFTQASLGHLQTLKARDRKIILDAIKVQLLHEPGAETRNRRLMRPNPLASWELRIGSFRVYYDLESSVTGAAKVVVLAVGIKDHAVVRIAGEEVRW